MPAARLVKVALPAGLVSEMDTYITKSAAYAGRTEFMTDAVENLLADLRASTEIDVPDRLEARILTSHPTPSVDPPRAEPSEPERPLRRKIPREAALAMATIREPTTAVPTVTLDLDSHELRSEPTWGMHNRDWPTIWAASMLGRLTTSGPIEYGRFKHELIDAAWEVGSVLGDEWDLAGFPSNESKAARSEARFVEFFVGSQIGDGPLFSFGMAAPKGSTDVVLTNTGADLLTRLSDMTRDKNQRVSQSFRLAFLRHLWQFAPADVEMLREVVSHIEGGMSTRLELIEAIGRTHPDWPDGTVSTNAAGYVARAREWGILTPKQLNHRYVVERGGAEDIGPSGAAVAKGETDEPS